MDLRKRLEQARCDNQSKIVAIEKMIEKTKELVMTIHLFLGSQSLLHKWNYDDLENTMHILNGLNKVRNLKIRTSMVSSV